LNTSHSFYIPENLVIKSAIRNFGGHHKAEEIVRKSLANNLERRSIKTISPLDLIVENIEDSANEKLSDHIARHLMILNRSQVGLHLLNHHVKHRVKQKFGDRLGWHIVFGSCFPGDLQVIVSNPVIISSVLP